MTAQRGTKEDLNRMNPASESAALGTKFDALITLANELRTDQATDKVSVDEGKTLIDELFDDHATFITVVNDLKTLVNDIRGVLKGDYLDGVSAIVTGSTAQNVANSAVEFYINGERYDLAAIAAGTVLTGSDIPQSQYGAWRIEVGANGTVDVIAASDNATGYASASVALADLPSLQADHVSLGTLTIVKSDALFNPGTTAISDGATTSNYIDGQTGAESIGASVSSSAPSTLTASKPTASAAATTAPAVDALPS